MMMMMKIVKKQSYNINQQNVISALETCEAIHFLYSLMLEYTVLF